MRAESLWNILPSGNGESWHAYYILHAKCWKDSKKWQNPKPPTCLHFSAESSQLNKWQQWNMLLTRCMTICMLTTIHYAQRCTKFRDYTEEKHLAYPDWSAKVSERRWQLSSGQMSWHLGWDSKVVISERLFRCRKQSE